MSEAPSRKGCECDVFPLGVFRCLPGEPGTSLPSGETEAEVALVSSRPVTKSGIVMKACFQLQRSVSTLSAGHSRRMAGHVMEPDDFRLNLLNLSHFNLTLDDLQLALNLSAQAELADCYCPAAVSTPDTAAATTTAASWYSMPRAESDTRQEYRRCLCDIDGAWSGARGAAQHSSIEGTVFAAALPPPPSVRVHCPAGLATPRRTTPHAAPRHARGGVSAL